jgi:adenylosuccinate lyase
LDACVRSARVDALFSEAATLSRYLQVEVALAETEAALSIIPEQAA